MALAPKRAVWSLQSANPCVIGKTAQSWESPSPRHVRRRWWLVCSKTSSHIKARRSVVSGCSVDHEISISPQLGNNLILITPGCPFQPWPERETTKRENHTVYTPCFFMATYLHRQPHNLRRQVSCHHSEVVTSYNWFWFSCHPFFMSCFSAFVFVYLFVCF